MCRLCTGLDLACPAGGLVSHVLHHCFEVSFEAMQWSVIAPSLTPSFCCVNPRFTAFSSSESKLNLDQCVCQFDSTWFRKLTQVLPVVQTCLRIMVVKWQMCCDYPLIPSKQHAQGHTHAVNANSLFCLGQNYQMSLKETVCKVLG